MFLAGGLVLALCGNVMAAQVYKWVDAQGVTHFGAQPPQGQQVETVNTVTAPAKSTTMPAPVVEDETEVDQQSIDRKVKRQVAEQEAERKRYCETMRTNLAHCRTIRGYVSKRRVKPGESPKRNGRQRSQKHAARSPKTATDTASSGIALAAR